MRNFEQMRVNNRVSKEDDDVRDNWHGDVADKRPKSSIREGVKT